MKILTKTQCQQITELIIQKLADYIQEYSIKNVLIGVSGGIDSSIVALLALKTLHNINQSITNQDKQINYQAYFLDCESDPQDFSKAQKLADRFKFNLQKIDLSDWYRQSPLYQALSPEQKKIEKIAQGNIKARLRMITLYHFAKLNQAIYLDTDDLSEKLMGFWTRHGDEGDVKIIQSLTKTELYDLGEYYQIPQQILNSPPADGLKVTSSSLAKDQLNLDYLYIEYLMSSFVNQGFNDNGSIDQIKTLKFQSFVDEMANKTQIKNDQIIKVIQQALQTAFKRKYGDNVADLAASRKELGLPELGSNEFCQQYWQAIKIENY